MTKLNGHLPQKRPYALSHNKQLAVILEMLIILMGGVLAAYMHFKLRIPLNVPGHHGLEFMAIFALVRLESNLKYAATLATLGVGIVLLLPGMAATSPINSLGYILPGLMLDMCYHIFRGKHKALFTIALISGLCYMSIPLSRLLAVTSFGYPYMAFIKHGVGYTILSFFFFGMMGGVLGYGLSSIKTSLWNNNQNQK